MTGNSCQGYEVWCQVKKDIKGFFFFKEGYIVSTFKKKYYLGFMAEND